MQTSEQGLALIKQYEGFSAAIYLCPAGKWTIGYGHVVLESENFPDSISEDDAQTLLEQDVSRTEKGVTRLVTADINQNQFDALVSLAYNIGVEAFENSTLLRLLNAGDTAGATSQFARWDHCNGKPLEGLANRRAAEKALFEENSA